MSLDERARRRLVEWMDASPITQVEIGKAVGHAQGWVSEYRKGYVGATLDELEAMARVFGHTITELLDLQPDEKEQDLLDAYRAIPEPNREQAVRTMQAMTGRLLPPPSKKRSAG